jgi:hypothetical protein
MRWIVTSLSAAMLLGACTTTGGGIDPCGPWQPILVSREDQLSNGTAQAILAHNITGQRLCGW